MRPRRKNRAVKPQRPSYPLERYRNGAEGFIQWVEENVCLSIFLENDVIPRWVPAGQLPDEPNPGTGRSYKSMWEAQKQVVRGALVMEKGRFKHRLIVLCWPRGEGKTVLVCLIQMWKFFCWPKQEIVLCANSKDQTKFVQYHIIRQIIENSPRLLLIVGTKNIQEKEIRLTDRRGHVVSFIRTISSFSGIVSNVTGYAFSEIFQMQKPEFFQQIDGSIRNIPNAIGVIDSTVSSKEHILYHLFETSLKPQGAKEHDPTLFFDYRCSQKGAADDYWHPNQTDEQLNSYRIKFVLGGFERYFKNLWSAGADRVFDPVKIEAMQYLGADGLVLNTARIFSLLEHRAGINATAQMMRDKNLTPTNRDMALGQIARALDPVGGYYSLATPSGLPAMAPAGALERLSDILDTDWAILAGLDRADPMKRRTAARTMFVLIAKGLPGSRGLRSFPSWKAQADTGADDPSKAVLPYVYFILHVAAVADHSLDGIKMQIKDCCDQFDGIDTLCAERWGVWDLVSWTEEIGMAVELVSPTYDRQRAAFAELYNLVEAGLLKSPPCVLPGSKGADILVEEMTHFDHDQDARWFGSPEKMHRYGVQDDLMYALGWGIYGARLLTPDRFRPRKGSYFWGTMVQPGNLFGKHAA